MGIRDSPKDIVKMTYRCKALRDMTAVALSIPDWLSKLGGGLKICKGELK